MTTEESLHDQPDDLLIEAPVPVEEPCNKEECFLIDGQKLTISLDDDQRVTACYEDDCHDVGDGEGTFNSLKFLLGVIAQPWEE